MVKDDKMKVKIIHGQHKGIVGTLTGVFWGANTVLIKTKNDEEIAVNLSEIETLR